MKTRKITKNGTTYYIVRKFGMDVKVKTKKSAEKFKAAKDSDEFIDIWDNMEQSGEIYTGTIVGTLYGIEQRRAPIPQD